MRPFQSLVVWQKAHQVTLDVYRTTATFPAHELYGLTSQMRRCAASIPSNIAEGSVFDDGLQFQRFLGIAQGSAAELEYHVILARDLGYLDATTHEHLSARITEIQKMLASLKRHQLKRAKPQLEARS